MLFRAQVRMDTREMVEHMQTFIVAANRRRSLFPQDVEQGYNVMKEIQQVLPRVFRGPGPNRPHRHTGASTRQTGRRNSGSTSFAKTSSNFRRNSESCYQTRTSLIMRCKSLPTFLSASLGSMTYIREPTSARKSGVRNYRTGILMGRR